MDENEILLLYTEKITSKVQDYISGLKITKSTNPKRIEEQIAFYSSEINNSSDYIIEEIFNERNIDLVKLFNENPLGYYAYSLLIRKTWVIKIQMSKMFDSYCEQLINSHNENL